MIITMSRNSTHGTKKYAPEGAVVCVNVSGEDVTRLEIFGLVYILTVHTSDKLANIPEEILLEDAFASNAEFRAKCIQARLCGVGLPTAIKDCERGVINHGDLVAVEIHCGNAIIGDNLSVSRRPVLVCLNSGAHLRFDLTHVWCRLFDSYRIHEIGGNTTDAVPLCQLTPGSRAGYQLGATFLPVQCECENED